MTDDVRLAAEQRAIKHLPQEKLRLIEIPLPDMERQRVVLTELDEEKQHCRRLATELRMVSIKHQALRRSLLEAAFSGRLTGRSSDMDLVEAMAAV